jgi:hypothetical protein
MRGRTSRHQFYKKAYSLYESGLSLSEVAQSVGVTRQCVFKAFSARGFQLRKKSERPFKMYKGVKFTLRNTGYYSATTGKRELMHRYMWEDQIGNIPEGWDIHHINEVKSDNRIENFECLPKSEHTRKYSPHNNQFTRGRKIIRAHNDTF